jgi:hypothetical protein
MSAGAVPFAVRGGGPREVIRDGVDGFLWSTPNELQEKTPRAIGTGWRAKLSLAARWRRKMANQARARSQQFTLSAFLAHMDIVVEDGAEGVRGS